MNFSLDTFYSVDIETTGLDSSIDRIIEIGAVKYVGGQKAGTFSSLINPGMEIPPDIVSLTGIDNGMVDSAPAVEQVIADFEQFLGDSPLIVGQNIRFDIAFLKNHLSSQYLTDIDKYFMDTAALARLAWPGLRSYGLAHLREFLNLEVDEEHRALPDAEIAAQVYLYELAAIAGLPEKTLNFVAGMIFGIGDRGPVLDSINNLNGSLPGPVSFQYEFGDNIIGGTSIEPREDFRDISVDNINDIFDNHLREFIDDYEERPQQLEMAAKVAESFNNAEILLAEAPTGIGKSLAYLVPSVLWADKDGDGVIISTQTKNLQDQLFNKDIPLVHQTAGFDFKAVLLKGRGNYLCLLKYYELLNEAINSYDANERLALMAVLVWAETTKTGDIAECTGFYPGRYRYLWSRMSCEGNFCLGRVCKYYKKCFLFRVRNEAMTAHLRVINHYLLFADFASGGELIRSSGQLVLDEAHNLEKVAASYLGPELNHNEVITTLNEVFTVKPVETGFLALVKSRIGVLESEKRESFESSIGKIQKHLLKTRGLTGSFFEKLTASAGKGQVSGGELREISYTDIKQYVPQNLIDDCFLALKSLETQITELSENIDMLDEIEAGSELAIRGRAIGQDLHELRDSFGFLTYPDDRDYVYWIELTSRREARLVSAPLDVGKILNEKLYDNLKTVVLCSATLSVAGDFTYYKNRLGLNLNSAERTLSIALDSPFDLKRNIGFFEAGFMPPPNTKNFDVEAAETIYQLFSAIRVRGMVLFTSYKSIEAVLNAAGSRLIDKGFELFVQNNNMSPFQLLTRYRQSSRGIIFGTDSFWEGVDLPGEELELLILAKLPFSVPDRPWIKANLEKIQREGGNPFMDLSLPEAVIKFRQGFGRLIRKKTDKGCVISLDSRLTGKQYGRLFIMSVKPTLRVCPSMNSLVHSTSKYFKDSGK